MGYNGVMGVPITFVDNIVQRSLKYWVLLILQDGLITMFYFD